MGADYNNIWANVDEAILSMKVLWTETKSEFSGEYYKFPPVFSFPSPVSKPHSPILVYGNIEESFEYVCKWGNGIILNNISPEELNEQKLKLNDLVVKSGRDLSISITISNTSIDLQLIKDFKSAGADRLIIDLFSYDSEQSIDSLHEIASNIKLY